MAVQALQVLVLWEWSASQAGMVVLTMWWLLLLTVAASWIYPMDVNHSNVANVEIVSGSDFCLISLAVANGRVATQSVTSALRNTFNIFQFSCDWKASQLGTVLISNRRHPSPFQVKGGTFSHRASQTTITAPSIDIDMTTQKPAKSSRRFLLSCTNFPWKHLKTSWFSSIKMFIKLIYLWILNDINDFKVILFPSLAPNVRLHQVLRRPWCRRGCWQSWRSGPRRSRRHRWHRHWERWPRKSKHRWR